jgi:uncharacterized cupredoxin-like copper-binding protein
MRYLHNRKAALLVTMLLLAAIGLTACGGSASGAAQKPVDVTVTLTEFKIESSLTDFKVGVPYHFIVTNSGTVAHEFRIMPPSKGTITQDEAQLTTLASISSTDLTPGATKTLDYTFKQAAPAGALEFACHAPGHYEAGMHLGITVEN